MDYEKKYKEALERAKELSKTTTGANYEYIFPELKESEDEKIRKEIIDIIKSQKEQQCHIDSTIYDKMLAWLEKQGEKVDAIENFDTEFEKQVSRLLASIINKDWEYTEGFVKWASNSLLGYAKHELGKQDEKKKELKEIVIPKSEVVDKIEPRFKVGDWVVANYSGRVSQVIAVIEDGYGYQLDDGLCFGVSWCDIFHLWCIKDARDGDVLALNNEVFIYAHRKQMYPVAVVHCYVDSAGGFYRGGEFSYIEKGNSISPATKEQRDTLRSKMKKAGYEWDSENKKLIKI